MTVHFLHFFFGYENLELSLMGITLQIFQKLQLFKFTEFWCGTKT